MKARTRIPLLSVTRHRSTRIEENAIFAPNKMRWECRAVNIIKDISPLTEFKRDTARMIAHIKETGRPQILTVNGKPSVVVMDAAAWQDMQDRLDHAEAVAGI